MYLVEAPHLHAGVATKYNGYGYQTWILGDADPRENRKPNDSRFFAAFGLRGQAIFVDPLTKLVVVHTAVWPDAADQNERGAQFQLWFRLLARTSQPKT